MLARARAEGNDQAVRDYVARSARLAAIFCGLLVGVVVAMPEAMLTFGYGAKDAALGADVLRPMVLAQGAFAMLGIATTILTSLGRERAAAWLTVGAVVGVGGACWLAVPGAAFGHDQLVRSAEASGAVLACVMGIGAALVQSLTKAFVPWKTVVRVGLTVVGCVALGFVMPHVGRLLVPVAAAVVGGGYVVVLLLTRELGRSDLAMLRGLGGRKRASSAVKPG